MNEQMILEQLQLLNANMTKGFQTVDAKMEALEQRMTEKIEAVEQRMMERIDDVEQRMIERINDVEQRMTEKIEAVEQRMTERQSQFEAHMQAEFQKVLDTMDAKFSGQDRKLAESTHDVKVYMELAVGNRVTALYEGYEIEHSHRVSLERDSRWLAKQLEDIQVRLAVLEKKETA